MAPRKLSPLEPQLVEMPTQKMAVVYAQGAPDQVFPRVAPALYGSAYTLKFALKKQGLPIFKVGALRARYPDAHLVAKDRWTIVVGLPIPEETSSLPQKVPGIEVKVETWEYGTVAQVLHLGPYDQEHATVAQLHRFIEERGYQIAGVHEEEYLTQPNVKVPKTLIRVPVRKK